MQILFWFFSVVFKFKNIIFLLTFLVQSVQRFSSLLLLAWNFSSVFVFKAKNILLIRLRRRRQVEVKKQQKISQLHFCKHKCNYYLHSKSNRSAKFICPIILNFVQNMSKSLFDETLLTVVTEEPRLSKGFFFRLECQFREERLSKVEEDGPKKENRCCCFYWTWTLFSLNGYFLKVVNTFFLTKSCIFNLGSVS